MPLVSPTALPMHSNSRSILKQRLAALPVAALLFAFTAMAQQEGPVVLVSVAERSAWYEEVSLSGSVVSPRTAELSTEVSGLVDTVQVELGDRVSAGDVILQLNVELETLSLAAAKASTEQARHELEDAERRLAEARRLGQNQSVSVTESLVAEVRIDTAELRRAEAEQQRQAAQIARHRLSAPFAGLVSRKHVERGEWIQPGQPVVELVAFDDLVIDFQTPQSVYARLDESARLTVRLDAFPERSFAGRIATVVPVTDPVSRTFLLRVRLNEPELRLAPGMSASALLRLEGDASGIVVSRDAIVRHPDGRVTVWIAEPDGDSMRVREQRVSTGPGFDGRVAISSGISVGDLIVVRGNEALYDRQVVITRELETAEAD